MAAQDITGGGQGQPITHVIPIVPNDTADLTYMSRGIYIGGAGDLTCVTVGGSVGTFVGLVAGTILPIRTTRVMATGTTATNLRNLL